MRATLQFGNTNDFQCEEFCRRDGTHVPVEFSDRPLVEEERVVGAVMVFRDVTEKQRAEQELRACWSK